MLRKPRHDATTANSDTAERRAPAPALRASPCNHSNLDISANSPKLRNPPSSAWSCRSRQPHSRQQRPRNFRLRPQSQRIALSSALPAALTISKRPARSRRRPFGVPSPCGKNGQENFRFPWDWQLRRPPASPPAAGKRARSRHPARAPAHAHARAQQPPSPLPIHPPLPKPLLCSSHRRAHSSLCATRALLPFAVLRRFFSAPHHSAAGCTLAPTTPRCAPAPSRLTPAQIPPAPPHGVFLAHLARPHSPALAASAPVPSSPLRHRHHAAIAAVASPAIGAGARSPSARFCTRNAPTASAQLTPRAGYRTAALAPTSSSRARHCPCHHRYHHDAGCRRYVRAATAMLLPAPVAPRLPPCGSHSRTGGAFLCCSSHFASSLADSRGAPE